MIDFNIILQNDQILLRPIKLSDIEKFWMLTEGTNIWNFTPFDLSIRSELEDWLNNAVYQYMNKIRLPFTIISKSDSKIIGSSSFGNISEKDKRIEIGWTWICNSARGKGVNDQVKFLMMQYCFDELKFERVEFKTDVLNLFARNALTRIGAKEEGVLRSHSLMTKNRRRDTIYYSVLFSEWEQIKSK